VTGGSGVHKDRPGLGAAVERPGAGPVPGRHRYADGQGHAPAAIDARKTYSFLLPTPVMAATGGLPLDEGAPRAHSGWPRGWP
jgi:hypothetical protein